MYIVAGIHSVIQFLNENSFYCTLYGSFLLLKLLFFISKGYQSGIPKNSNISSYSDVNCQIRQFDEILHLPLCSPKGQLISKWFLGVVDFLQKTNENKSHCSKVEFIRSFFGGNQ